MVRVIPHAGKQCVIFIVLRLEVSIECFFGLGSLFPASESTMYLLIYGQHRNSLLALTYRCTNECYQDDTIPAMEPA